MEPFPDLRIFTSVRAQVRHAGRARFAGHEFEVVGDAYAIASNYLRKSGAIADTTATNERLIELIVKLFQHGEFNRIRLANKAIAKFEASASA